MNKRTAFLKRIYPLRISLNVNFQFETSHVYSLSLEEFKNKYDGIIPLKTSDEGEEEFYDDEYSDENETLGYLVIDSVDTLHPYDAPYEMAANLRPRLLVIYGVLTFLTDYVFDPRQCFSSYSTLIENDYLAKTHNKQTNISVDDQDYSTDLEKLLSFIAEATNDKKILIFSVLERWRKALHLMQRSDESSIYYDEAVLAYIHIFEVLADDFTGELKSRVKRERDDLVLSIIERAKGMEENKTSDIGKIAQRLTESKITLKMKVFEMLKTLDMFSGKSEAIMNRFIEHRNSIAHGRKDLYQDKVVYPLAPFFSFIKDIDEDIEAVKFFSARLISKYLGINRWKYEWDMTLAVEFSTLAEINEFIRLETYKDISNNDFMKGNINGIIPEALFFYHTRGKLSFASLEAALSRLILSSSENQENCERLFNISLVLANSKSREVSLKSQSIIKSACKNQWHLYSSIQDPLKEMQYRGMNLPWFESWLAERAVEQRNS